jgi:hypothetical protein
MSGFVSVWTDARVERLRQLHADGFSMSQIAALLNRETQSSITRNAVVGKGHRLGLYRLVLAKKSEDVRRKADDPCARTINAARRRAKVAPATIPKAEEPQLQPSIPEPVHGVAALEPHHCRYPLNSEMTAPIFCGAHRLPDSSFWFCYEHHLLCVGRGTEAERRAAA